MPSHAPRSEFVTVVSGIPRSGTSLMMQMLAAGGVPLLVDAPDVARVPDRDNPNGYFEYAPVKRLHAENAWLPGARGRAVKVIHALLTALGRQVPVRVLFLQRDLAEVVASQGVMLERGGHADDALPPDRLAAIFRSQADDALAWLQGRPRCSVLMVEHAAALASPAAVAAEVDRFLGGGLDRAAMAAVVDPGLQRQRADRLPRRPCC